MSFDLFKGLTKRNWAREPNQLLTIPVPSVALDKPGERLLRDTSSRAVAERRQGRPRGGRV
jgi:hypothetical protein